MSRGESFEEVREVWGTLRMPGRPYKHVGSSSSDV